MGENKSRQLSTEWCCRAKTKREGPSSVIVAVVVTPAQSLFVNPVCCYWLSTLGLVSCNGVLENADLDRGDGGFRGGVEGVSLADDGHDFGHGVFLGGGADEGDSVPVSCGGDVVVIARASGEEGAVVSESWLLEHVVVSWLSVSCECACECGSERAFERRK